MNGKCLRGRKKIYTDVELITENNVIAVLRDALIKHDTNRADMLTLFNIEKGDQPLDREKTVRKDIDICCVANLANEITEFNLGYYWGNPIAIVQKSDKNPKIEKKPEGFLDKLAGALKKDNHKEENNAITLFNNMYAAEDRESKDQELGYHVETVAVGYQMIDVKRNVNEGDSVFDLLTLNPRFTFVVYSSNVGHKPMLGVTYIERENGTRLFTCISDESVYIVNEQFKIVNGEASKDEREYLFGNRSGEKNPLGEVYIIEFERSYDRMGCFERQIDDMDVLNTLESDFANDVAQNTQAIWWGNDIELDENEDGSTKGVQAGQWILTKTTGNNNKPVIQPLTLQYDYNGVLQNIQSKHDSILERSFIPKQSDPGGGSTTGAMSLSSGWAATEAVARKKDLVLKKSFQRRNRLALKVIKISPDIKQDNPLLELSANDIDIRFPRQKNFDIATKVNALSTMLNCMVNPRVAMATIDLFPNLAEAVEDSVDNMELYQQNLLKTASEGETEPVKRNMTDSSDQLKNSPLSDI